MHIAFLGIIATKHLILCCSLVYIESRKCHLYMHQETKSHLTHVIVILCLAGPEPSLQCFRGVPELYCGISDLCLPLFLYLSHCSRLHFQESYTEDFICSCRPPSSVSVFLTFLAGTCFLCSGHPLQWTMWFFPGGLMECFSVTLICSLSFRQPIHLVLS